MKLPKICGNCRYYGVYIDNNRQKKPGGCQTFSMKKNLDDDCINPPNFMQKHIKEPEKK